MSSETVRCSRPDAFMAPKTVPMMEQQMPTKAIMTMNHRIETVCVTVTTQQDLGSSSPKKWDLKKAEMKVLVFSLL